MIIMNSTRDSKHDDDDAGDNDSDNDDNDDDDGDGDSWPAPFTAANLMTCFCMTTKRPKHHMST